MKSEEHTRSAREEKCRDRQYPFPSSTSSLTMQTSSGLARHKTHTLAIPTAPLPQSSATGDLSVLAHSVKLQLLHCALKGLQAPGATQAPQAAGVGPQNNRLLPHPIDLNPVHACPSDSSSAPPMAPLPALPHRSSPFIHKETPLNKERWGEGTTHCQIVGGGVEGRWCTPRSDLATRRRPSEAWDKLMSIVLLFLSESKSKSNYKTQW